MKKLCFVGIFLFLLICQLYADVLPKPNLVDPKDDAVFNNYPRKASFSWQPVQSASKYQVEIQFEIKDMDTQQTTWMDFQKLISTECYAKINSFPGAQRGRWRVTAIDATGAAGQNSGWRTFRFTK